MILILYINCEFPGHQLINVTAYHDMVKLLIKQICLIFHIHYLVWLGLLFLVIPSQGDSHIYINYIIKVILVLGAV